MTAQRVCLSGEGKIEARLRGPSGLESPGSEPALLYMHVLCVTLGVPIAGR